MHKDAPRYSLLSAPWAIFKKIVPRAAQGVANAGCYSDSGQFQTGFDLLEKTAADLSFFCELFLRQSFCCPEMVDVFAKNLAESVLHPVRMSWKPWAERAQ